jgi:hypothetical protein
MRVAVDMTFRRMANNQAVRCFVVPTHIKQILNRYCYCYRNLNYRSLTTWNGTNCTSLFRQFTQPLSISTPSFLRSSVSLSLSLPSSVLQTRLFGSKKKESTNQKNKAKQKSMIKKQLLQKQQQKLAHKTASSSSTSTTTSAAVAEGDEHIAPGTSSAVSASSSKTSSGVVGQHSEWVEFQKSIAVEGFETGQILSVIDATKKGRSGNKAASKKRLTKRDEMAEKIRERQRLAGGGGGEFPPMRYSDAETERLLQQAYASIPPRTGPRGTLQLKRQKRRWHLVREIHRKYKGHIMQSHERRMKQRSKKIRDIMDFTANVAPAIVQQDIEYQNQVRQRYRSMLVSAAAVNAAKAVATA